MCTRFGLPSSWLLLSFWLTSYQSLPRAPISAFSQVAIFALTDGPMNSLRQAILLPAEVGWWQCCPAVPNEAVAIAAQLAELSRIPAGGSWSPLTASSSSQIARVPLLPADSIHCPGRATKRQTASLVSSGVVVTSADGSSLASRSVASPPVKSRSW